MGDWADEVMRSLVRRLGDENIIVNADARRGGRNDDR